MQLPPFQACVTASHRMLEYLPFSSSMLENRSAELLNIRRTFDIVKWNSLLHFRSVQPFSAALRPTLPVRRTRLPVHGALHLSCRAFESEKRIVATLRSIRTRHALVLQRGDCLFKRTSAFLERLAKSKGRTPLQEVTTTSSRHHQNNAGSPQLCTWSPDDTVCFTWARRTS
uniref:Uncharacterized protein n=1 Tax=Trichuris muris TaxID=70415 RepID=A0A5S6Q9N9_TRIMR